MKESKRAQSAEGCRRGEGGEERGEGGGQKGRQKGEGEGAEGRRGQKGKREVRIGRCGFFSRQVGKFVVLTFSEVKKENYTILFFVCIFYAVFFFKPGGRICVVLTFSKVKKETPLQRRAFRSAVLAKIHASRDVLFNNFVWSVFSVR